MCEDLLDQIRTEAVAALDQWWADDLLKSLLKIQRLADLGLEGKRLFRPLEPAQADPKSPKKGKTL